MIWNAASVVVSKFATFRYRSPSELRNQNDTRNQYVASVLSIPKFAKRRYRDVTNFGIGTLGPVYIVFASRVACENRPMAGEARKAYRVIRLSASTNHRAISAATRRDAPPLADRGVARPL